MCCVVVWYGVVFFCAVWSGVPCRAVVWCGVMVFRMFWHSDIGLWKAMWVQCAWRAMPCRTPHGALWCVTWFGWRDNV